MDKTYKNRYELKYVLDYPTAIKIKRDIEPFLRKDSEGDERGCYEVISVYYDTNDLRFFWEKVEGENERVKLRLRCYKKGEKTNNLISIEVKKKRNKIVSKKRALLPEDIAKAFLEQSQISNKFINEASPQQKSALHEIAYLKTIFRLQPKIAISYTRQAFISRDGFPLRITFDEDVRYRKDNLSLKRDTRDRRMLMPYHIIMEIKHTDYFPVWLLHIIQKYGCQVQSFSKYCAAMEHVLGEQNGLVY